MNLKMENEKKYVIALDLSLSCTGVCIFDENGNPVEVLSIPTNPKHSHGERLKTIADKFIDLKNSYDFVAVVLEAGFSRFSLSTQAIFKCHGVANYIFWDKEQVYYAPSSVKKTISGNGKTDKTGVRKIVEAKYPNLKINNDDESDAISIGMAYFINKKGERINE